jgi:hypothetical protein
MVIAGQWTANGFVGEARSPEARGHIKLPIVLATALR